MVQYNFLTLYLNILLDFSSIRSHGLSIIRHALTVPALALTTGQPINKKLRILIFILCNLTDILKSFISTATAVAFKGGVKIQVYILEEIKKQKNKAEIFNIILTLSSDSPVYRYSQLHRGRTVRRIGIFRCTDSPWLR